jgi:hypothetical protein
MICYDLQNERLTNVKNFYTYPELKGRGIDFTREHIRDKEKKGTFPMHTDLDGTGRRIGWERTLIDKYQAEREQLARDNAKAARAKTKRIKAAKLAEGSAS